MNSFIKSGTVIEVVNSHPKIYKVMVDSSLVLKVLHTQINPRPSGVLAVGTRLSIYEIGGIVKWASVDSEDTSDNSQDTQIKDVTVSSMDDKTGVVVFQEEGGRSHRLRMLANYSNMARVYVGLNLQIEITHTTQGEKTYRLIFPSLEPRAEKQEETHFSNSDHDESEEQSQYDAEKIGIDPAYFHEREKEGHRYEIMAFLAEHLHDDLIEWYRIRPAMAARHAKPLKPLHPTITQTLRNLDGNFKDLFLHQARALDSIRAGRNLIVVTQTASGKTLCYNPAIFEYFISNNKSAHALYIFPLTRTSRNQKGKVAQGVACQRQEKRD